MVRRIKDKFGFLSVFDDQNGDYVRTGILDEAGKDSSEEPFRAEFPQLLDIGIMGHCAHGLSGLCKKNGTECYQSGGSVKEPNMPFAMYRYIIDQCRGRVFQVALGGRGDPDQHENFEAILRYTRENQIVPNITTSGYGFEAHHAQAISAYCGAAAVSYYKTPNMHRAVELLLNYGVTTNLHFVLGNNSIDEAIWLLSGHIPDGIAKVIFLLHKPIGFGSEARVLQNNEKVRTFFSLLQAPENADRLGFDSCMVPGIVSHCPDILHESFDACEAGRFSAYIGADGSMCPCSFDQNGRTALSINDYTIEEIFNSETFEQFRNDFLNKCPDCRHKDLCFGGCPIAPQIRLCAANTTIREE